MATPPSHGPVCIGVDNGCPDCAALSRTTAPANHGPVCIGLDAGCPDCIALSRPALSRPRVHVAELDQWRALALDEIERYDTPDGAPPRSAYLLRQACDRIEELERPWFADEPNTEPRELPRASPADVKRWRAAAAEIPGPIGRCIQILTAEVERQGAEGERQRQLLRRVRCYAVVDPLGNPTAITLPHAARMLGIERDIDDCLEGRPSRPNSHAFAARPEYVRDVFSRLSDETSAPDASPPKHHADWHWCSGGCGRTHLSHYAEDPLYRCACGATCQY